MMPKRYKSKENNHMWQIALEFSAKDSTIRLLPCNRIRHQTPTLHVKKKKKYAKIGHSERSIQYTHQA